MIFKQCGLQLNAMLPCLGTHLLVKIGKFSPKLVSMRATNDSPRISQERVDCSHDNSIWSFWRHWRNAGFSTPEAWSTTVGKRSGIKWWTSENIRIMRDYVRFCLLSPKEKVFLVQLLWDLQGEDAQRSIRLFVIRNELKGIAFLVTRGSVVPLSGCGIGGRDSIGVTMDQRLM